MTTRASNIGQGTQLARFLMGKLCAAVILTLALASPAQANFIHPGAVPPPAPPPGPGPAPPPPTYTETYSYTPSGGRPINFTVTVTAGESAEDKADAIVAAITDPAGKVKGAASRDSNTTHPEEINSAGTIALVTSTSGEADKLFSLGGSGGPGSEITVAFGDIVPGNGMVTGIPFGSLPTATYDVSFGYDGVTASSSVSYGNSSTVTLAELMTDTYDNLLADLPSSVQPDLSLNLSTDTITFALAPDDMNPFVVGDSLDQGVFYSESLTLVPEPATLSMVGLGGFYLVVFTRRRRESAASSDASATGSVPG